MKLAVLADIHANFSALQTVVDHLDCWKPDAVVVAGDTVNRGPRPLECLQFVQRRQQTEGWQIVRGNHEDYVLNYNQPNAVTSGPAFEIFRCAYWTYQQLNGNISALEAMPFQANLSAPNGSEARIVHASMKNNRNGIFPKTSDDSLRQKIRSDTQPAPSLFCVGHTHIPLIRHIDNTLVVNVGAVGLPFDADPRAAYAQITWHNGGWSAEIIRLDYDRQQTEKDYHDHGFLEGGGPLVQLILDELHCAESNLYQWTAQYHDAVIAGDLSLQDSVTNYLANKPKNIWYK